MRSGAAFDREQRYYQLAESDKAILLALLEAAVTLFALRAHVRDARASICARRSQATNNMGAPVNLSGAPI